jgi:hypothetical protein
MIVLSNTVDKIQVSMTGFTSFGYNIECYASYRDTTSTTISPGSSATNLTGGVFPTDLVAAPAASTQRIVDYISMYNGDVVTNTVTVLFTITGVANYVLATFTLAPGEKLEYQEGAGFKSLGVAGDLKQSIESGYTPVENVSYVILGSDVITASGVANTLEDITGLSFAVTSGKTYWFRFVIPFATNNTGNGSRFSINGPTTSSLFYESSTSNAAGGWTLSQGLSAYGLPAAATTASATLLANTAFIQGIATFSASGTLIARFAAEGASPTFFLTARAGAVVHYKELN